jgi:hypothetical protein
VFAAAQDMSLTCAQLHMRHSARLVPAWWRRLEDESASGGCDSPAGSWISPLAPTMQLPASLQAAAGPRGIGFTNQCWIRKQNNSSSSSSSSSCCHWRPARNT